MSGIAYLGPEGTFTEAALRAIESNGLIPGLRGPVTPIATDSTAAALAAGDSLQLTAPVSAAGGGTLNVPVEWATLNPGRATVSSTGLVRALSSGSVQIVATYGGVGGSSQITIP